MIIFVYRIGLAHIGRVGSVFVTVAITTERYLESYQPRPEQKIKWQLIVLPIVGAVIYSIPKFFELKVDSKAEKTNSVGPEMMPHNVTAMLDGDYFFDNKSDYYYSYVDESSNITYIVDDLGYSATALRLNNWYVVLYIFCSKFIFVDIIPWVTVIVLNFKIWKKLKDIHRIRRQAFNKECSKYCRNIF